MGVIILYLFDKGSFWNFNLHEFDSLRYFRYLNGRNETIEEWVERITSKNGSYNSRVRPNANIGKTDYNIFSSCPKGT